MNENNILAGAHTTYKSNIIALMLRVRKGSYPSMSVRKKDMLYEGRREAYLDIDRMINEGMAGGTVLHYDSPQIDATTDLPDEEPPRKSSK